MILGEKGAFDYFTNFVFKFFIKDLSMKNRIIALRIFLLSFVICFQAMLCASDDQKKAEQENIARKQNLDKQVEILEKLENPLGSFSTSMENANGVQQMNLRKSLKNNLNNLKKELESELINLFPGKSWNDFGIIETKEVADNLLLDVQKRKNELLTQIEAIPLTEEQKNAEVERLKQKAEKEQADKKAEEEAAKIKAEKEAEEKEAKRIADEKKQRNLELVKLNKLNELIDKIIDLYKNNALTEAQKTIRIPSEKQSFTSQLNRGKPKLAVFIIDAFTISDSSNQPDIEKIQNLIKATKKKMKKSDMDSEAALKKVLEAEKPKKYLELEPALKALKDKLNGLKEKLKKLRRQLTKLKGALGAPVT